MAETKEQNFDYEFFSDIPAEIIIEMANDKCEKTYKQITTNQVRNIFGHINTIRNSYKIMSNSNTYQWNNLDTSLLLTKPKLAYAVGRVKQDQRKPYNDFQKLVVEAIDLTIRTPEDKKAQAYENFFALIEAIVAYHKYHGGKDK